MKFEYNTTSNTDLDHLDDMGSQYWELVCAYHGQLVFKRPMHHTKVCMGAIEPDGHRCHVVLCLEDHCDYDNHQAAYEHVAMGSSIYDERKLHDLCSDCRQRLKS